MLKIIAVLAALASLTLAAPATAQAPSTQGSDEEARALFDAGSVAYTEGRYANALEHFRRAYELSGRAQLLYNIGISAERLRRDEEALTAFREYLVQVPDTDQRAAVESRIAILETAVAAQEAEETAAAAAAASEEEEEVTAAPSVAPPPASPDLTGPIVLMASGGVVAIVGGALLGVAAADGASVENAERGTRWDTVSDAYSRAEPLSIVGAVALGVGAAAAVGGVIWLVVPQDSHSDAVSIRVLPGPGAIAVRGSF